MRSLLLIAGLFIGFSANANVDYKVKKGVYLVHCKDTYDIGNTAYSIAVDSVSIVDGELKINAQFYNLECKELVDDKVMFTRNAIPADWSIVALNWNRGWFDLPSYIGDNIHKTNAKKGLTQVSIPLDEKLLKSKQLKKMKNQKPFELKLSLHLGKETDRANETFVRSQGYWDLKLKFTTNKKGELTVERL